MRNWRKYRDRRRERSDRARRAAEARWAAYHAALADEPVREDLPGVALRLTLEQPGQMRRVIELRRRRGMGARTMIFENGAPCRPGGKCAAFRALARQTEISGVRE